MGGDTAQSFLLTVAEFLSLISRISKKLLQERIQSEQSGKYNDATIAILDVGRRNGEVDQEALRIDADVTFLAFDLLAAVALDAEFLQQGEDVLLIGQCRPRLSGRGDKNELSKLRAL